jgi:uncharacterized protein (TIGR02145 family)
MKLKYYIFTLLILATASCSKEKDNPFDPNADVDFSPTNIIATIVSPYVIKLQWDISSTSIDGFKIDKKTGTGSWVTDIALNLGNTTTSWTDYNCQPNTEYVYRIYAIAGNNTSEFKTITKTTTAGNSTGTFTDSRDGKTYKWVKIGSQTWMAENLAYIPYVCPPEDTCGIWVAGYNGTNVNNAKSHNGYNYGCLYNWNTAKNICPPGWHLPSDDEWYQLINYLGGSNIAGDKMRETGREHWSYYSNNFSTNESGFTAFAGGYSSPEWIVGFHGFNSHAYFWTSTGHTTYAYYYQIDNTPKVSQKYDKMIYGYSVRCVKD